MKMKYLIISDLHSVDLDKVGETINFLSFDSLICLSDFDSLDTLRQFRKIEEKRTKEGLETIILPGNHDDAVLRNISVLSPRLTAIGKTIEDLHYELISDQELFSYLAEINKVKIRKLNFRKNYKVILMHGAYDGNMSTGGQHKSLWARLRSEEDYLNNFNLLKKNKMKGMIRGHDHYQGFIELVNDHVVINDLEKNKSYEMKNIFIINPGPLCDGNYATIETEKGKSPVVKFEKLRQ